MRFRRFFVTMVDGSDFNEMNLVEFLNIVMRLERLEDGEREKDLQDAWPFIRECVKGLNRQF